MSSRRTDRPIHFPPIVATAGLIVAVLLAATTTKSSAATDAAAPVAELRNPAVRTAASLVRVVDGDTIDVRIRGRTETVRLIGVNAPETDECFARQATRRLTRLLRSGTMRLIADTTDRDQYGRLLRYVRSGGRFVNAALVRSGHALATPYPPDIARQARLDRAERRARDAERGIWGEAPCGRAPDDSSPAAGVGISDLVPDAPGNDHQNPNGEWVIVTNDGPRTVALGGWTLRDRTTVHRYEFAAGFRLAGGASVRLFTGCGRDTAQALYWCNGGAVWNNDGDTAYLVAPDGSIVSTYEY